jgi:hypothetical protein
VLCYAEHKNPQLLNLKEQHQIFKKFSFNRPPQTGVKLLLLNIFAASVAVVVAAPVITLYVFHMISS